MQAEGRDEPGRWQVHVEVQGLLAPRAEAHDEQEEWEEGCPMTVVVWADRGRFGRSTNIGWLCGRIAVRCTVAEAISDGWDKPLMCRDGRWAV